MTRQYKNHSASSHQKAHRYKLFATAVRFALAGLATCPALLSHAWGQSAPAVPQASPRQQFDLPAAPLDEALEAFARQAAITLPPIPAALKGMRANSLKGSYTIEDALTLILHDSGWQAEKSGDRYVLSATSFAGGRPEHVLPSVTAQENFAANSTIVITEEEMRRRGVSNFGDIVKDEPLISAPKVSNGQTSSKSGVDRGGYRGYNIRGIEGNRIGLYIDSTPLPSATGRPYAGRDGATARTVSAADETISIQRYSSQSRSIRARRR